MQHTKTYARVTKYMVLYIPIMKFSPTCSQKLAGKVIKSPGKLYFNYRLNEIIQ